MAKDKTRIELLQGTLDLLILRTLVFGPSHGHAIAKQIRARPKMCCRSRRARSIRRCTGWRRRAGSPPQWEISDKGKRAKSYRLTAPAGNSSWRSSRSGNSCRSPWPGCCGPQSRRTRDMDTLGLAFARYGIGAARNPSSTKKSSFTFPKRRTIEPPPAAPAQARWPRKRISATSP